MAPRSDLTEPQTPVPNPQFVMLCNHIAARRGGRAPQDYTDCFAVLLEMGVTEDGLAKNLQQMTRFRNLLVHVYGQVDNRLVY